VANSASRVGPSRDADPDSHAARPDAANPVAAVLTTADQPLEDRVVVLQRAD
jgi:hypothetical protein